MKQLSLTVLSLCLLSCGFNNSDDSARLEQEEQEERRVLKASYEKLTGFYSGVVQNSEKQEVFFLAETVDRPIGKTPDGKDRFSVALQGRVLLVGSTDEYLVLGTYYETNQEVVFVSTDTNDGFALANARYNPSSQSITATLRERGGVLGPIELFRASDTVKTPQGGWNDFREDRKECFLENIVGEYTGEVKNNSARLSKIQRFSMTISRMGSDQVLAFFIPKDRNNQEVRGLRLSLTGSYSPRDGSIELETNEARRSSISGRIRHGFEIENLAIAYPAGLIGIASGENQTKLRASQECISSRCTEGDKACIQRCIEECSDRDFLLEGLL